MTTTTKRHDGQDVPNGLTVQIAPPADVPPTLRVWYSDGTDALEVEPIDGVPKCAVWLYHGGVLQHGVRFDNKAEAIEFFTACLALAQGIADE